MQNHQTVSRERKTSNSDVVFKRPVLPIKDRYAYDGQGTWKYYVDVDLAEFPQKNICVQSINQVIIIQAEKCDLSSSGDKCTHKIRREIQLPRNVDVNTVSWAVHSSGRLSITADLVKGKNRVFPPVPQSTPPSKPNNPTVNDNSPSITKKIKPNYQATKFAQTDIATHKNIPIQCIMKSSQNQPTKRFLVTMHVGPNVKFEDLSIYIRKKVITITARDYGINNSNYIKRERISEHTIPTDVNESDLTATLKNGVVYVEAPYRPIPRFVSFAANSYGLNRS